LALLGRVKNRCKKIFKSSSRETDALYKILYDQCHDLDQARELRSQSTLEAFSHQWSELPKGEYLLSDPWFRDHVESILSEQELLLRKSWFKGKEVLDAGCGNGRWAYGLSKLGANITCVDGNRSALSATREAISPFANRQQFIHTRLEELDQHIRPASYDLVFSWGVLHHCVSFTKALHNITAALKPGGLIYLYLYGRESLSVAEDVDLFKKRVVYNVLLNKPEREKFLLKESGGDRNKVHNVHDVFAPLINRRFHFAEIEEMLKKVGFTQITRTIDHTEIFLRAVKGQGDYSADSLAPRRGPYWFQSKPDLPPIPT
jgi:2-polyprenyl-3-methyl-5-hydroxy-6-metoxy-1,4-benzoquinol methylase